MVVGHHGGEEGFAEGEPVEGVHAEAAGEEEVGDSVGVEVFCEFSKGVGAEPDVVEGGIEGPNRKTSGDRKRPCS